MKIQTLLSASLLLLSLPTYAKVDAMSITRRTAENQIRHLLEPLLDKFCHDECKLLGVNVGVDYATPDEIAPGFEDSAGKGANDLAPSNAQVTLLMDDKVGPISRGKLLDLIQQYLDTLEYPVKVDTKISHFPVPQGSEGRVAAMREKISKQFLATADELIKQFCPETCLLSDFDLKTDIVNGEEAQYGGSGEFVQDGDTAIRIKDISATLLMDQSLTPQEQANLLEMLRFKTNSFKHVTIQGKSLKFPKSVNAGEDDPNSPSRRTANLSNSTDESTSTSTANNTATNNTTTNEAHSRVEKTERIEKIERVENGDAVQAELKKFKIFGIIFGASVLLLLIFIAIASTRKSSGTQSNIHKYIQESPFSNSGPSLVPEGAPRQDKATLISQRYEIERLFQELAAIYAQQPRVAKHVFSRVLIEEGVEVTAECMHIFGEGIMVDMLHDPSLQSDMNDLLEFYAKNPIQLEDADKLDLLRKLHSRTLAGKLAVLGNRSSSLFEFLADMDGTQILELIRTESLTVKAIILTQCDAQKRATLYAQLDADVRMKLLGELSRIDYLPKDYIYNVASALKRKRKENPKLNTEALPGSEVLVSLLERTGQDLQKTVVKNLELTSPDSARTVKSKLVSVETLKYLRDGQLLEVVLSLKHDELVQFLKGVPKEVRQTILSKSPKDLAVELEEEVEQFKSLSRESYQNIERKVLNRMKVMANEGHINLVETNDRMFSVSSPETPFIQGNPDQTGVGNVTPIRRVG